MKKLLLIPTILTVSTPLVSLASCGLKYDAILNQIGQNGNDFHIHSKVLKFQKGQTITFKVDMSLWKDNASPNFIDFQTPEYVRAFVTYELNSLNVDNNDIKPSDDTWKNDFEGYVSLNEQFAHDLVSNKSIVTGKIMLKQDIENCWLSIFNIIGFDS